MKKLIQKIEKNQYIKFVSIIAVVLSALITITNFVGAINSYLYSNVFLPTNISDKISILSPGQSFNYFKQVLGSEILQREVSEKYTEYFFRYKTAFVQTLVNKQNNEVIYWAITYCGKNPVVIKRQFISLAGQYTDKKNIFGKDIINYSFSDKLFLNKSSFTDIFKNTKGEFKYFIGNTANSFAYESVYLGNPSAYQTIIIGVNDICPSTQSLYNLGANNNASQEMIEKFRENSSVNTYGETAPFYDEEVVKLLDAQHSNEAYITFGIDRIRVRYFNK